jgi:hypothetical protein
MKRGYILVASSILGFVAVMSAAVFVVLSHDTNPIPKDVRDRVSFTVFLPETTKDGLWKDTSKGTTFDAKSGVLTSTFLHTQHGGRVVINQQHEPDTFNDIPGYYEKMLQALNQYSILNTGLGTFTLTHPSELKGGQTAVGLVNGTLLFIHPDKNMSDSEWKDFLQTFKRIQ